VGNERVGMVENEDPYQKSLDFVGYYTQAQEKDISLEYYTLY
jgi:hypothetical protein